MLTSVQYGLIDLLQGFCELCKRHNIEFYMGGGCLIGAIRHQGFLPWDDDVDIHMTKSNYEKLLSVQEDFPEGCMVVSDEAYNDYPTVQPRYMCVKKTTGLRSTFLQRSPSGQFIDILILYPVPDDSETQEQIIKSYNEYIEIMERHVISTSFRDDELIEKYNQSREHGVEGYYQYCNAYKKRLFNYDERNCNSYLILSPVSPHPHPIFKKELWGKPKWVPFEDIMVPVAERPEEVLLLAFGDRWIDIPQQADRGAHVFVNDLDLPCELYEVELQKYVSKQENLSFLYFKKDYWFSILSDRNYVNQRFRILYHHLVNYKLIRQLITKRINLRKLAREGKYFKIKQVFLEYYEQQLVHAKYYNVYMPLCDRLIYYAMLPLLYEGEYSKVRKVLGLRSVGNRKVLPTYLKSLENISKKCAEITSNIYTYFDYNKARELVNESLIDYPNLITLYRADICLDIKMGICSRDTKKRLIHYLSKYPYDGELLKYYGDILKIEGANEKAIRYYKKALGFVNNGMVRKEIKIELGLILGDREGIASES